MNKKRKFISIALAGALFCGVAGTTFVGCKDYDDDINSLDERVTKNEGEIAANKKAIEDIQNLLKTGVVLTNVMEDENGLTLTLSNGNIYQIKNGKAGKTPTFTIENGNLIAKWSDGSATDCGTVVAQVSDSDFKVEAGHLFYKGKDMGQVVGQDGQDAKLPNLDFRIEDNSLWLYVDGVKKENLGVVKGEAGTTPAMPSLQFKIDESGYLLYKFGDEAWMQAGDQKVVGEPGKGVSAADFKFVIHEGKLYVNPNADFTEGEIGSVVAGNYTVNEKGELCVNGASTGILLNGEIFMTQETNQVTLNMPVISIDGTVTYERVVLPTQAAYELVKGRIQSVVYVPATADKMVHSYSLEGGIQAEKIAVCFKIYPETFNLVTAISEGKAKVGMDAQVLSKSADLLSDLTVVAKGAGLWEITATKKNMTADGYAAALVINYNETTVSSDYFTIENKTISTTEMEGAIFGAGDTRSIAFNNTEGIYLPAAKNVNGFDVAYAYEIIPEVADRAVSIFNLDAETGKLTLSASDQQNVGIECKVKVTAAIGEKSFERIYAVKVTNEFAQISSIVLTKVDGAESCHLLLDNDEVVYPTKTGNLTLSYKVFPQIALTTANLDFDIIGENVKKKDIVIQDVKQSAGITVVTFNVNTKIPFQIATGVGDVYSAYTKVSSTDIAAADVKLAQVSGNTLKAVADPIEIIWKGGSFDLKDLVVAVEKNGNYVKLSDKGFDVGNVQFVFKKENNPNQGNYQLADGVVTPKNLNNLPVDNSCIIEGRISAEGKVINTVEIKVSLVKAKDEILNTIDYAALNKVIGVAPVQINFNDFIVKSDIMNSLHEEQFQQEAWKINGKTTITNITIYNNTEGAFSVFPTIILDEALESGVYTFTNNFYVTNEDGSKRVQPVSVRVNVTYPTESELLEKKQITATAALNASGLLTNEHLDELIVLKNEFRSDYKVVFSYTGTETNLTVQGNTFSLAAEPKLGAAKAYTVEYEILTKTDKKLNISGNITMNCNNPFGTHVLTERPDGEKFVGSDGIVTFAKTTQLEAGDEGQINLLENVSLKTAGDKEVIPLSYGTNGFSVKVEDGYGLNYSAEILNYTAAGNTKKAEVVKENGKLLFKWTPAALGETPFAGQTFTVRITVQAPYAKDGKYTKDITIKVLAQ